MRTLIVSTLALGILLLGTIATAETPAPVASPVATLVNYLTTISAKDAAAGARVCCQVSGTFGNLFVQLAETHCLAVPGMPSDDSLCKN